ncbi:hypothetical protein BD410DRAFT_130606 [Rickenella mellea]|uniref:AP180 N-terminal homology (ANTH) domain-containing protein n=1 Tax=Rickenella mellea TaxID=50990 RepID=A0A4Y7Q8Q3_9AGAM|nr:hypothetical protein BD410DRAFT_130606 [Rickenella mellea]
MYVALPNSISTISSPPHILRMALSTMSVKHSPRAFEILTLSCVSHLPRLRADFNTVLCQIVFTALIVLHTMMCNGAGDNTLLYLASSDVIRLKNVSIGQREGYSARQNLQNYSAYLDIRIRTYKDLKHAPVHVQSEVNRYLRWTIPSRKTGKEGI